MADIFTYTYSTLRQTLQDWLENDATEFTNKLDEIIGLGEIRISRDVDLEIFRATSTPTCTISTNTVAKPSDYIFDRAIFVTDSVTGKKSEVLRKDTSYIYTYWPDATQTALPKYFSDLDTDSFILAPTPDKAYTLNIDYIKRLDALSGTNATNWYSTKAPDALLYACLLEASEFNKSEKADIAQWQTEYEKAIARLTREENGRKRRNDGRYGEPIVST